MKIDVENGIATVTSEPFERLEIYYPEVYPDRIVVFKPIGKNTFQEIHIGNFDGKIIDRESRKKSLPKFVYEFPEYKIRGEIEHLFVDEMASNVLKPKGIDLETFAIHLFCGAREIEYSTGFKMVNKSNIDYYQMVKEQVEDAVSWRNIEQKEETFLRETYSKWSPSEKGNYLFGQINWDDHMQGGWPTPYRNPVAPYLTKWFVDTYSAYDKDIMATLDDLCKRYNIDTKYLGEMVKYEEDDERWKSLASQLKLIR